MHSSRQERSRRTAERLLNAAEQLAGEIGFERLTLAEVARRAECTTGAVYGRFGSKAALLDALHIRHIERGKSRFANKLPTLNLSGARVDSIRALVTLFVDEYQTHWPIIDAFAAVLSTHPKFATRNAALIEALAKATSEALTVRFEDAILCIALVMGTLDRTLRLRQVAPRLPLFTNDELTSRLTLVCTGLLGIES